MIEDPDRFQKLTNGIQSIILSIAVLVGGGWTLYVYNTQLQVENAKAQLVKINRELSEQANIETTIILTPHNTHGAQNETYISGVVTFKNNGNRVARICLNNDNVEIFKVCSAGKDKLYYKKTNNTRLIFNPNVTLVAINVFPGTSNNATFIAKVPDPGIYLVSCGGEMPLPEQNILITQGSDQKNIRSLGASTFVRVGKK